MDQNGKDNALLQDNSNKMNDESVKILDNEEKHNEISQFEVQQETNKKFTSSERLRQFSYYDKHKNMSEIQHLRITQLKDNIFNISTGNQFLITPVVIFLVSIIILFLAILCVKYVNVALGSIIGLIPGIGLFVYGLIEMIKAPVNFRIRFGNNKLSILKKSCCYYSSETCYQFQEIKEIRFTSNQIPSTNNWTYSLEIDLKSNNMEENIDKLFDFSAPKDYYLTDEINYFLYFTNKSLKNKKY